MRTLAQTVYLDSEHGVEQELPRVGSALEIPHVFDAAAKELKSMAAQGLVEIVSERQASRGEELLIEHLRFKRLR